MRLFAAWSRRSRSSRIVIAGVAGVVALLGAVMLAAGISGTGTDAHSTAGVDVPADQLQMINAAASACPSLTPARLAGQIMANTGFNGGAERGIAGLTDDAWQRWAPRPGALRTAPRDNIDALAHQMCDLVGQVRSTHIGGDQWRLSLASFVVGVPAVTDARGVPGGVAATYVAKVDSYTMWYSQQRQFGGPGDDNPDSSLAAPVAADAVAVPDSYVAPILAAGTMCPVVSPARIAAQLMAHSGFNPNKLGAAGQMGIAQFREPVWATYNTKPLATPWGAADAVVVLGRAMCDLVSQVSAALPAADAYAAAISAFDWGVTSIAQAGAPVDANRLLAAQVNAYVPFYSADPRLSAPTVEVPPAPQPTSGPPAPAPAPRPSANAQAPAAAAPPVFPAPGARSAFAQIQAESFSNQSGTEGEVCNDTGGGQDIGKLAFGDWLEYEKVDFGSGGASAFYVRFASELPTDMTGWVEVRIDAPTNAAVGSVQVGNTGGWQSWSTVSAGITRVTGVHTVYLTFWSNSGWEIGNINWITFRA